jgi:hypothetical protein
MREARSPLGPIKARSGASNNMESATAALPVRPAAQAALDPDSDPDPDKLRACATIQANASHSCAHHSRASRRAKVKGSMRSATSRMPSSGWKLLPDFVDLPHGGHRDMSAFSIMVRLTMDAMTELFTKPCTTRAAR